MSAPIDYNRGHESQATGTPTIAKKIEQHMSFSVRWRVSIYLLFLRSEKITMCRKMPRQTQARVRQHAMRAVGKRYDVVDGTFR